MDRTVNSNTYDAWRMTACLSIFLLSITGAALVFNVDNEESMRRCLIDGASPEHCLLTVHGR